MKAIATPGQLQADSEAVWTEVNEMLAVTQCKMPSLRSIRYFAVSLNPKSNTGQFTLLKILYSAGKQAFRVRIY
jgi:hypothetical protein